MSRHPLDIYPGKTAPPARPAMPDAYEPGLFRMRSDADVAPPADVDAQLKAMSDFREQIYDLTTTSIRAAETPATSKVHLEPPDPYAAALDEMRTRA